MKLDDKLVYICKGVRMAVSPLSFSSHLFHHAFSLACLYYAENSYVICYLLPYSQRLGHFKKCFSCSVKCLTVWTRRHQINFQNLQIGEHIAALQNPGLFRWHLIQCSHIMLAIVCFQMTFRKPCQSQGKFFLSPFLFYQLQNVIQGTHFVKQH